MYHKTINTILNKNIYDIPNEKKFVKRFVCHSRLDNNYTKYAKGLIDMANAKACLKAICYNSYTDYMYWNVRPTSLYFYTKTGTPVISDRLCKKILKSVNKDFMQCVENMILDYYVKFKDGVLMKFKDYPLIYKAMGYIACFPITYFETDFTNTELQEITKCLKGQVFVLYLKDKHKVKIVRKIDKTSFETVIVDLNMHTLITIPLYFMNKPEIKINEMIEKINENPKNVKTLINCF